jgi:hypothetical protein
MSKEDLNMQMKESIQATMLLGVVLELATLTGEGTEEPIKRIGIPYEVGKNQKTQETYIRMYVTHTQEGKGAITELPADERKFRTVPLHKIMEDSLKRHRELTYYPVPVK